MGGLSYSSFALAPSLLPFLAPPLLPQVFPSIHRPSAFLCSVSDPTSSYFTSTTPSIHSTTIHTHTQQTTPELPSPDTAKRSRSITHLRPNKPCPQGTQEHSSLCQSKISRPSVSLHSTLVPVATTRASPLTLDPGLLFISYLMEIWHPISAPTPLRIVGALKEARADIPRHRPLRRSRRRYRRDQAVAKLHPYSYSA